MWPLTFFVKSLPRNSAGMANGPVVRILTAYKDDKGLYEHEWVHVKQWFFTLGLHTVLYALSNKYKLWSEVQAYKEQAKWYSDDRKPLFAKFISEDYGLNITQAEASELLDRES